MELNGKFMQAVALAALLPAAAMLAGCEGSGANASNEQNFEKHTKISGKVVKKHVRIRANDDYNFNDTVIVYSKDLVGTQNDLTCVRNWDSSRGSTMSCNWDQANGMVPAPTAP